MRALDNRLKTISSLRDGWYYGEGKAPTSENIAWFSNVFQKFYDKTLPLPFLYPTVEGYVQAEWVINQCDISLNIDFLTKIGHYHSLNQSSLDEEESEYKLDSEEGWNLLNQKLIEILKA